MMNKVSKKTFAIGIIFIVLGLIIISYAIMFNNDKRFKEFVIDTVEDMEEDEQDVDVEKIYASSKKIQLKDEKIRVKGNKLYINDRVKEIDGEKIVRVTGYYYQPADTYNIFVLTASHKIYSIPNVFKSGLMEHDLEYTGISDVSKLILLEVTVEDEMIGLLPERNRVYALVNSELVLVG